VRDSSVVSLRVAYLLEQCWHRVPGGTATSALGVARAFAASRSADRTGGIDGIDGIDGIELVGVSARHGAPPSAELIPPVPVRALPLPRRLLYETWHTLGVPAVQRATGPVDVIHATGMAVPPRTAPLVVTVHDLAFERYPQHATRNGLRFFRQSLRRTRERADLVLCPSEATRRDCIRAGIAVDKLRVVPWGVDVPASTTPDAVDRTVAAHGLRNGKFVLFVGTVEPRKNLRTLVEAYRRVREELDVDLALVGPAGWNEDLDALLRPVREHVRLLGYVPRAELDALYAGAAVFCYPSLLEGFGMPVLEAMAAGAVVVTSAGTATEEVAGDAGLLVDPLDAEALAVALARACTDPSLAATLRARARARAATFTWARAATATADAYRACVA
jgi:glycosyltransferase involved in cell wall biosynthesis